VSFAIRVSGAAATVSVGPYELIVQGAGVDELASSCRGLLEALASGRTSEQDARLAEQLGGVPAGAQLHSWLFASFVYRMPALFFAIAGEETWIYTRTHEESEGLPLVVLHGRDLAEPVRVPTREVVAAAQGFLAEVG
jgi:hypothetical protein